MGARRGFTFFELLLVITIIAILAAAAIFLINPPKLFAKARNGERVSHVNQVLNAIGENIADHRGSFSCAAAIPTSTATRMATSSYDIAPCLVPAYLATLPADPSAPGAHYASNTDYDTGYTIVRNASSGRITVAAPAAELGQSIAVTR